MWRRRRFVAGVVLVVGLGSAALGATACSSSPGSATAPAGSSVPAAGATTGSAPGTTVAVVKDILATQADPPGAPGRTLTLIRYTIAPGAKLSPHVHPGIQLAEVESGTLTYTVVSGTATVHRGGPDGPAEQITGPATTTLGPRDTVSELGDMVHFGANDTTQPLVINATLLTGDGQDLAVTVTTAPGAAPATTP